MTPADLFGRAAQTLFGAEYVAPMAKALNVERSTVRKMANGQSRVAPGMWQEIADLIEERERVLPALKAAVLKEAGSS